MLRWILYLEIAIIVILGPLVFCDPEHRSATAARVDAPGRLIRLSDGVTHFDLSGPASAPLVVLVSGLATPGFVWDHTRADLVAAGYRVLRYDLYGRGYSDRPRNVDYTPELYDRQLLELLEGLRLRDQRPAHIIGLSMGGVISIRFARYHPRWVRSLTLIAPAGFLLEIPALARIARVPVIGDYFIHAFGHSLLMRGLHRNLYNQELFASYREQILPQMYIVGTKAALLSSVRHMPLSESQEIYRQVAATGLPMQIFWGREDRVIPLSIGQTMHAALPTAEFYAIPGAGHIVHWEQPQAIRKNLLHFLKVH